MLYKFKTFLYYYNYHSIFHVLDNIILHLPCSNLKSSEITYISNYPPTDSFLFPRSLINSSFPSPEKVFSIRKKPKTHNYYPPLNTELFLMHLCLLSYLMETPEDTCLGLLSNNSLLLFSHIVFPRISPPLCYSFCQAFHSGVVGRFWYFKNLGSFPHK